MQKNSAALQNTSNFDEFVERLIVEKNFPELTPEVHAQIKSDLLAQLNRSIKVRLVEALPDDKAKEFMAMLDKNPPSSPDETQKFIADNIPDLNNFMSQILLDFRKTYLGLD